MTKSTITREQLEEWVAQFDEDGGCDATDRQLEALIRQSLAAMDQKPAIHRYRRKAVEPYGPYPWHYEEFVDLSRPLEGIEDEYYYASPPAVSGFAIDGESECLPLDYLQGHKDGLEWAAQLAEANHPETGDWLYDDPIELAKAIRKGPDMPPAQPAKDREQVRREHAEWSQATFGNVGPVGPLKHLSKEALEAAEQPGDLSEWADMQFLLWDAQRRAGITDEQITQAMIEKLAVNKQREWPEPKDGEPRLHIKEQPAPVVPKEWAIADAVNFCKETGRQDAGAAMDAWNAYRAAMLSGGKP